MNTSAKTCCPIVSLLHQGFFKLFQTAVKNKLPTLPI